MITSEIALLLQKLFYHAAGTPENSPDSLHPIDLGLDDVPDKAPGVESELSLNDPQDSGLDLIFDDLPETEPDTLFGIEDKLGLFSGKFQLTHDHDGFNSKTMARAEYRSPAGHGSGTSDGAKSSLLAMRPRHCRTLRCNVRRFGWLDRSG